MATLAGVSAAVSSATAALTLALRLAGVPAAVSTSSGSLGVDRALAGLSAAVSTATGSLAVEGQEGDGGERGSTRMWFAFRR